jgi:hypothetical protein
MPEIRPVAATVLAVVLAATAAAAQPSEAFDRLLELPAGVGDRSLFGRVVATGDVDGDGRGDFAASGSVGSGPSERGYVRVARGAAPHALAPDAILVGAPIEDSGTALAFGDFDDDGRDELVIARPGRHVAGQTAAGDVGVYRRLPDGSWPEQSNWNQASGGVPGAPEAEDRLGAALAVGDFDGDGVDDLAIGVPGEAVGGAAAAGAVLVLYGDAGSGLTATGSQLFHQDVSGVPGGAEEGDRFGSVLAAGDVTCDGIADLVVGAPDEDAGGVADAGTVTVLPGAPSGVTTVGAFLLEQSDFGAVAEATDRFGSALAIGRMSNVLGACRTLFVGAPAKDVGAEPRAGVVFWYRDGATDSWTESDTGGVEGEQDRFGTALAVGDFTGDGLADLAIGVPGQDYAAGPAKGGVRVLHRRILGQFTPAGAEHLRVEAGVEAYDHREPDEFVDFFGAALAAADLDDDGYADLVVGMPLSDLDGDPLSGGVEVLFSAFFSEDFEGEDLEEWSLPQP